jgi:hypothetical protein
VNITSMRPARLLACASFIVAAAVSLDAQWLKLPTPGLPRLADGKPDLRAPAPRTADGKPDLSGLWSNDGGDRYYNNVAADLQVADVAPWAHELFITRQLEFGKDSMETLCLPLGPAYLATRYRTARIVQTPALIMIAFDDGMHMASTTAAQVVQVPAVTLARYVGTYDTDNDGQKHVVAITQEGTSLWFDYDGVGKELLIALTPERFSWSGTIVEFSPAAADAVNVTIHYVESTERGSRRR